MKHLWARYLFLGLIIAIAIYFLAIPVRLAAGRSRVLEPQAIFVLGGEKLAARLARRHPDLDVWVSTGSKPEVVASFFETEEVPLARLT